MKRLLTFLLVCLASIAISGSIHAQETMTKDIQRWAEGWKYSFSPEGKKAWTSEFTARARAGIFTSGAMFTGGVRVDDKRTLGLFIGYASDFDDATPAYIHSYRAGLSFRRYWHFGQRQIFSIYSDIYAGAGYIYNVTDEESYAHKGDIDFVGGWQPGVRVRFWRNVHLFLGPTIATDCFGLHLGIGF